LPLVQQSIAVDYIVNAIFAKAWAVAVVMESCYHHYEAMSFTDVSFVTMISFEEKSSITYNGFVYLYLTARRP
jgi:hypothetical protein